MKLAIINSHSIQIYLDLGYTWVFDYYNPNHIFDGIWYYAIDAANIDNFYKKDFFIHMRRITDEENISKEIILNKIDVIRNYESGTTAIAIGVGKKTNIPVILSIH